MRYQFQSQLLRRNQYKIYNYFSKQRYSLIKSNYYASIFDDPAIIEPQQVLHLINSLKKNAKEAFKNFCNHFLQGSRIGVVLGKRRHGKTATVSCILEKAHKKGIYIAVYNFSKSSVVPEWINHHVFDPKKPYYDVPPNSLIFHDEIHLDINAKDFSSSKNDSFRTYLSLSGHKSHSLLFTSQIASNIPLDLIKYSDYVIMKPLNIFNKDNDRAEYFSSLMPFTPTDKPYTLVRCNDDGSIWYTQNDLPNWYTEEVSKAFA